MLDFSRKIYTDTGYPIKDWLIIENISRQRIKICPHLENPVISDMITVTAKIGSKKLKCKVKVKGSAATATKSPSAADAGNTVSGTSQPAATIAAGGNVPSAPGETPSGGGTGTSVAPGGEELPASGNPDASIAPGGEDPSASGEPGVSAVPGGENLSASGNPDASIAPGKENSPVPGETPSEDAGVSASPSAGPQDNPGTASSASPSAGPQDNPGTASSASPSASPQGTPGNAFSGSKIRSVVISDGTKRINSSAFLHSSIESITIGKDVQKIYVDVFEECPDLESVSVDPENQNYSNTEDKKLLLNKDGTKVVFGCGSDVVIPEGVTEIAAQAFDGRDGLTSVVLPDSLETIGDDAFWGCKGLKSIHIPANVRHILHNPFKACSNLETITVDPANEKFDSRENCNAIIGRMTAEDADSSDGQPVYGEDETVLLTACKNTVIPEGVTVIGDAYERLFGVKSVLLPQSLKKIGESAFYACRDLVSITVPEGVTEIGEEAFCVCPSLVSVYVPSSVTDIGYLAFGRSDDGYRDEAYYAYPWRTSEYIGTSMNLVVHTPEGSAAEEHAKKYHVRYDNDMNIA